MAIIYNLFIHLMYPGIKLAGIFDPKTRKLSKGLKGITGRIEDELNRDKTLHAKTIWVHCASLGEFEQGRPIIESLRQTLPGCRIVVTFFSPSGYEVRKNYEGADHIFYLPTDTPSNARRFVAALKPDIAIFVKYEYWYNYLSQLKKRGIPTYVISAIFRPGMYFFKPYGGFFRHMLQMVTRFFVQDQASADLLASIGIEDNVTVSGDTRFDRVALITQTAAELPAIEQFVRGDAPVMVCGSTWPADQKILVQLMHEHPQAKFIIAPHEIDPQAIDRLIEESGRKTVRYKNIAPGDDTAQAGLLVVDCIGILSGVYRYGDIAYLGGGFGAGIHNVLEAAVWGMPVIFGPRHGKFKEAVDLVKEGGAFAVNNYDELNSIFSQLTTDPAKLAASGEIAAGYVRSHTGGTSVIVDYLTMHLTPDLPSTVL